jgi:hypothetical protein
MLRSVEAVPYERACGAALAAMRALGLRPVERDKDGFQTLIVGVESRGVAGQSHEISVRIARISGSATEFRLQAAGDPDGGSLRPIHDAIRRELQDPSKSPQGME